MTCLGLGDDRVLRRFRLPPGGERTLGVAWLDRVLHGTTEMTGAPEVRQSARERICGRIAWHHGHHKQVLRFSLSVCGRCGPAACSIRRLLVGPGSTGGPAGCKRAARRAGHVACASMRCQVLADTRPALTKACRVRLQGRVAVEMSSSCL